MMRRPMSRECIEIGSRRELFVDDFLIDRRDGLELRLQSPVPREIVLEHDAPWEGSGCGYHTIFRDGDIVRMYYIAADLTNADGTKLASRPLFACYAESRDGIHWVKPELGLFEFAGSKKNNIVWSAPKLDNFTPFKDTNPDCPPERAVQGGRRAPAGFMRSSRPTASTGRRWPSSRSSPRERSTPRTTPSGTPNRALLVLHPRLPRRHSRHPRGHLTGLPNLDRTQTQSTSSTRPTSRSTPTRCGRMTGPRTCSSGSRRGTSNAAGRRRSRPFPTRRTAGHG